MKFQKESRIGFIITVSIIAFIWGVNFLKGRNIFTSSKQYYAVFQNIGGLQESSIVTSNGYTVGTVTDIVFKPGKINKIVVEISVERKFKVPDNSIIEIYSTDFMGSKAVNLILGDSPNIAHENDTLPSRFEGDLNTLVSKKLMPLKDKTENLIVSLDSVSTIIRNTFTPEAQKNIRSSIAGVNDIILSEKEKIGVIVENMRSISENLENNNKAINKIIKNLSTVSDSLAAADLKRITDRSDIVLAETQEILAKINNGTGSMGKLINNDTLYNMLNKTIMDLDTLVNDLNKNPKKYVHFSLFGSGKNKKK